MKTKVKITVISGVCSIICATISAWVSYNAGYKNGMLEISQKVNNEITQVVNVDNGDYLENLSYVLEKLESGENSQNTVKKENTKVSDKVNDFDDVHLIDSYDFMVVENFQDSYGRFHEKAYQFDASDEAYAVFNLDGKYKSFSADIVAGENTNSGSDITINLETDSVTAGTIRGVTKLTNLQHIEDIDVEGVTTLEIIGSDQGSIWGGYFYLVNVELVE